MLPSFSELPFAPACFPSSLLPSRVALEVKKCPKDALDERAEADEGREADGGGGGARGGEGGEAEKGE